MTEFRRNPAIDLLRAASILYIVGYWHLLGYVDGIDGYKNALTYRLTVVVLGLFTLMAGLLAGRRSIRTAQEVWSHYRTRALRILPPYGLALVLFGLTGLIRWPQVGLGLVLLPAIDGEPLRTLWYVNALVIFSFLAPLLLWLRHRLAPALGGPRRAGLLVAAGLALLVGLLDGFGGGWLDPRLPLYFPAFAVGLLLSRRLLPGEGDPGRGPFRWIAPLGLLSAVAIALSLPVPLHQFESLRVLPLATIVPLLILVVAMRWLEGRTIPNGLQAISYGSYFMYLLHRPLFQALNAAAHALCLSSPGQLLSFLLLVGLPLIVLLSWWGQCAYDRVLRFLRV
ncbi:MAG: acyltransferase family protein [Cyanobium sp.]